MTCETRRTPNVRPFSILSEHVYHWLHVPSGRTGYRVIVCDGRLALLNLLNHYNYLGRGRWVYWTL